MSGVVEAGRTPAFSGFLTKPVDQIGNVRRQIGMGSSALSEFLPEHLIPAESTFLLGAPISPQVHRDHAIAEESLGSGDLGYLVIDLSGR